MNKQDREQLKKFILNDLAQSGEEDFSQRIMIRLINDIEQLTELIKDPYDHDSEYGIYYCKYCGASINDWDCTDYETGCKSIIHSPDCKWKKLEWVI